VLFVGVAIFVTIGTAALLAALSRNLFAMSKLRVPVIAAVLALVLNLSVCALLPGRDPTLIGLGAVIGFTASAVLIVGYLVHLRSDV